MPTPWGRLRVVAIEDLAALKKTNRAADYDVITRLALIRLSTEAEPSRPLLRWAAANIFRAEDLAEVVRRWGERMPDADPAVRVLRRRSSDLRRAATLIGTRMQRLQDRGRQYWLPRIEELRALRRGGKLLPEGTPVCELLRTRR